MIPSKELSECGRRVVEEFVRLRTRDPSRFNTEISPEDEMYLFQLNDSATADHDECHLRYLESGKLMLEEYRMVVDEIFGGFDNVDSILEFACGHGRFTRFLVQESLPEKVFVSDIYPDAVDFQEQQFGVQGTLSVADPDDYQDDRRYQLILVSSLFSHLPAKTFSGWLGRLFSLLTEDGVLIFSVHDEAVMPENLSMDRRGIAFVPNSESRSLDSKQYGTTFVNETFVRYAIDESCPGTGGYVRIPKGLWRYQDLYVVSRGANRKISDAGRWRGPQGYLERCRRQDSLGCYSFEGWAYDFDDGAVVDRVDLRVRGVRVQTCIPTHQRRDVADHFADPAAGASGWACLMRSDQVGLDDLVSVELVSSSGRVATVAFDVLERLLS